MTVSLYRTVHSCVTIRRLLLCHSAVSACHCTAPPRVSLYGAPPVSLYGLPSSVQDLMRCIQRLGSERVDLLHGVFPCVSLYDVPCVTVWCPLLCDCTVSPLWRAGSDAEHSEAGVESE